MTVRPWHYEDILEISKLEALCFTTDAWSYQMVADAFLSERFIGYVLVNDSGEVAAYCGMNVVLEEADILLIATRPEERRKGYAEKLLRRLVSAARKKEVTRMFLEVRTDNESAKALYEKLGFKRIAIRQKYYGDADAFIMERKIKKHI